MQNALLALPCIHAKMFAKAKVFLSKGKRKKQPKVAVLNFKLWSIEIFVIITFHHPFLVE